MPDRNYLIHINILEMYLIFNKLYLFIKFLFISGMSVKFV